jgi:hypothetical protein
MAHKSSSASSRETIGHTVSPHSFPNVAWTPNCENVSVDWTVERGIADDLDLLRLLMQCFPNPIQKVKNFFTGE